MVHAAITSPNPIALGVGTFVAVLSGFGLLLRQKRQTMRSDAVDKRTDKYADDLKKDRDNERERFTSELAEMRARLDRTEIRMDALQDERNELVSKLAATESNLATAIAKLEALQQRLATVEMENQRLRDENGLQELRLQECDREARAAQRQITALKQEIADLRRRQDRSEESSAHHDGTSAPPGSQATGTVLGTLIEAKSVKPEGEI